MLADAARNAEVSGLKRYLEWTEEELGRVKKQLEDNQGILITLSIFNKDE